jgi:hypothetical protein
LSFTDSFSSIFTDGNNTVSCTLILSDGSSKLISTIIEIDNNISVVLPEDTKNVDVNVNSSFTASFFARSGVKSVLWNFGDGSSAYGQTVNHIYSKEGAYIVSIILTSNKNHTITKTLFVNVVKAVVSTTSTTTTASTDTSTTLSKASVTIYATKLNNIYSYRFEAVIENYNDSISSYWWEFNPNRKTDIDKTTSDYTFNSLSRQSVTFKIRYKDNSISSHLYTFSIYDKKLQVILNKGWNLISSPIDSSYEVFSTSTIPPIGTLNMNTIKNRYVSLLWIFSNGAWVSNPNYIPRQAGIWVKSTINYNVLSFSGGSSYIPTVETLSGKNWHLIGTGEDLSDFNNKYSRYINSVHIYENGKYIKNPRIIKKGQGFWVQTR